MSDPRTQLLALGEQRPTIEVLEAGTGAPLVFLHGAGGIPAWTGVLPLLAERFRVVAPLLPGYGQSTGLDYLEDHLDLILHQFDVLAALGLERPCVVGESMGGWIAAEMAALRPAEVSRLILAAPVGLWRDAYPVADMFGMMTHEIVPLLFHDQGCAAAQQMLSLSTLLSEKDDRSEEQVEMLIAVARGMRTAAKFLFPVPDAGLEKRLWRITAPTLIVWGAEDGFISPTYGKLFCAGIRGAKLHTIPAAGHLLALEQPAALADAIKAFA